MRAVEHKPEWITTSLIAFLGITFTGIFFLKNPVAHDWQPISGREFITNTTRDARVVEGRLIRITFTPPSSTTILIIRTRDGYNISVLAPLTQEQRDVLQVNREYKVEGSAISATAMSIRSAGQLTRVATEGNARLSFERITHLTRQGSTITGYGVVFQNGREHHVSFRTTIELQAGISYVGFWVSTGDQLIFEVTGYE